MQAPVNPIWLWIKTFGFLIVVTSKALAVDPSEPTAGRWISPGNGPSHSGFYPATLGSGAIIPGWIKSFGRDINPVAVSDGRVFVTATNLPVTEANAYSFAVALDSSTGAELWRYVLPAPADTPIVNGRNLLVEADTPWAVFALGSADGSLKWVHPFANIVRTASAPTAGDHIWLSFGLGSLLNVRISDNLLQSVVPFERSDRKVTSASYSAGHLYVTDGNIFEAVDPETAAVEWQLPGALGSEVFPVSTPAIAAGKAVCLASFALTTIDLQSRTVLWTVNSPGHTGLPATDGSAVYALSGAPYSSMNIRAYQANTGTLLGEYPLTGITNAERFDRTPQPLVTNDAVLVATDKATYIFDKASYALRARLPIGGFLSYAAGTLYIATPAGDLDTYHFAGAPAEAEPPAWPAPTPSRPAPQTNVEAISINPSGTSMGNESSGVLGLSGNGRYVLFESGASNLSPLPDTNRDYDYFVRDRQLGTISLVTANGTNTAAAPLGAEDGAVISRDGQFVAFASDRYNLVSTSPASSGMRIFVRDLRANKTSVIGPGSHPKISGDGHHVLFWNNGSFSVYNLADGTANLVNPDNPGAIEADLSGDGRYVIFTAPGTGLSAQGYPAEQCYLRNMTNQTVTLISKDASGTGMGDGDSARPLISQDGKFVSFNSRALNLVTPPIPTPPSYGSRPSVYRYDVDQGNIECLTRDLAKSGVAGMSRDGQVIAISDDPTFPSRYYVYDARTGVLESLPYADALEMDGSGRFFAYSSYGGDLTNDINNDLDVFLYDRTLHTRTLLSHNLAGTSSPSGAAAELPHISEDGQTVGFTSTAFDLVITPKISYAYGSVYLDAFVTTSPRTGQLLNISTRGKVASGEGVLIGGFIVTGSGSKKVLLRAIGPSLSERGVSGAIQDPILELHDASGAIIAMNDNWTDDPAAVEESGLAPSNPVEAALVRSLSPANYTAVVRTADGSTGVGLIELYDLEGSSNAHLGNISTRGLVSSGDNVLIGGLIAGATDGGAARVLVRAIGPSLVPLGIANALDNPTLELRDSNGGLLAANDDWKTNQEEDIETAGLAPTNDRESAVVATFPPGNYTVIVRSGTGVDGIGLVEVYHLQ